MVNPVVSLFVFFLIFFPEDFAPRCLQLLSNSTSTLTSLSLSAMYIEPDLALPFFALRFPLLRSFTSGTWDEGITSFPGFHDFILAHSETLEDLAMEYSSRREVNPTNLSAQPARVQRPLQECGVDGQGKNAVFSLPRRPHHRRRPNRESSSRNRADAR